MAGWRAGKMGEGVEFGEIVGRGLEKIMDDAMGEEGPSTSRKVSNNVFSGSGFWGEGAKFGEIVGWGLGKIGW